MVIGIAGRALAGKTTVSNILQKYGFIHLDVDKVGHKYLEEKKEEIVKAFGPSVLDKQGNIDRKRLGDIVFSDPTKLRILEKILHPPMVTEITDIVKKYSEEGKNVVLDAAILYRLGLDKLCDVVIFVDADEKVLLQRALERGWNEEKFRKVMESQKDIIVLKNTANFVINNSFNNIFLLEEELRKILGVLGKRMKIGILGFGAVARFILPRIKDISDIPIWIYDRSLDQKHIEKYKELVIPTKSFEEFINSEFSLMIECASIEAVKSFLPIALEKGKDVIVLSTGAFADTKFLQDILDLTKKYNRNVYIASGAVGGIDVLKALRNVEIESITLTTKKPPKALGLKNTLEKPEIVFEGDVKTAIERFPKNINVAITLSLAIGDMEKLKVRIIADPSATENTHEVEIKSPVGEYFLRFSSKSLEENPATSTLAPLSIIALLQTINSNFKIGS